MHNARCQPTESSARKLADAHEVTAEHAQPSITLDVYGELWDD